MTQDIDSKDMTTRAVILAAGEFVRLNNREPEDDADMATIVARARGLLATANRIKGTKV